MLVEAGASREGLLPDAGDAITNRDARQAGAFAEGVIPNTSSLSDLARSAVKKFAFESWILLFGGEGCSVRSF